MKTTIEEYHELVALKKSNKTVKSLIRKLERLVTKLEKERDCE